MNKQPYTYGAHKCADERDLFWGTTEGSPSGSSFRTESRCPQQISSWKHAVSMSKWEPATLSPSLIHLCFLSQWLTSMLTLLLTLKCEARVLTLYPSLPCLGSATTLLPELVSIHTTSIHSSMLLTWTDGSTPLSGLPNPHWILPNPLSTL